MKIVPVIMCGGVGTRLWPLSRASSPKQFQRIDSERQTTFFQATAQRHTGSLFAEPYALVNEQHLGYVTKQLREIQLSAQIVVEPASRNTAPALAAAALRIAEDDPGRVMLSLPSDHLVDREFNAVVEAAFPAAAEGFIVTFGIKPRYAETGYGYIMDGGPLNGFASVRSVLQFVEKPAVERAQQLIDGGGSYWASGISLFTAGALIAEFAKHAPDILEAASRAIARGTKSRNAFHLDPEEYGRARNVSCEYAVFERCAAIALAPAQVGWDDVGAWSALYRTGEKNAHGNVVMGDTLLLDTANCYVRSEEKLVTVIGMSDIIVVDTADALLIADRSKTQAVKAAVEALGKRDRAEIVEHRKSVEDWGTRQRLAEGHTFSLRYLKIGPEQTAAFTATSPRALLLTVIQGHGEFVSDGVRTALAPGDSLEVEPADVLDIRNVGPGDLHIVEMMVDRDSIAPIGEDAAALAEMPVRARA